MFGFGDKKGSFVFRDFKTRKKIVFGFRYSNSVDQSTTSHLKYYQVEMGTHTAHPGLVPEPYTFVDILVGYGERE